MFPKIMNDENYYNSDITCEEWHKHFAQDDRHLSGIRFARRIRLPRICGLAAMFFPIAGALVIQAPPGEWWLILVGWAFVWPHLAWQRACRSADPRGSEILNLKVDAIIAGIWIGLMGASVLPSAALVMMIGMNMMGAGGVRLFIAGMALTVLSSLVTLQLCATPLTWANSPLETGLALPVIVLYPLLFAWISYLTAIRLAEHKLRLEKMSTRDGMTGVFNRRHWEMLLHSAFDTCRRNQSPATMLIIDIDHFKSINDTWGHDVGDEAIIAVTRQIQLTLRAGDIIGRFGGDEFAVIMGGTPAESAIAAMSRVHERLKSLTLPNAPQVRLRISVGIAPWAPAFGHYREWLKAADVALYKAKNAGRNRTEVAA